MTASNATSVALIERTARESMDIISSDQAQAWVAAALHIGQVRSALLSATLASSIIVQSYREAVKTNGYIGLPYTAPDGSARRIATLDEFCDVFIGRSKRRCQELASNLDATGSAELYEQAELIGLRQRDYNALKALPAEDRAVINRALESGADRETVIEQLVTLTERQIAQKAKLAEELADARGTMEAKDKRAGEQETRIEGLRKDLSKARLEATRATPDETAAKLREKCHVASFQCRADISYVGKEADSLYNRFTQLRAHADDQGNLTAHDAYLGGLVGEVLAELRGLRDQIGLPIVGDYGDPAWSTGG